MNRKTLHKICFVLLLTVCSLANQLQAQTEREIMTSGIYYWGQAIAEEEENAKLSARDELMIVITNDIQEDIKAWPNSDVLVNGIRYFSRPRGPRFLAVAYIEKENVEMIMNGDQMIVTEVKYKEETSPKVEVPLTSDEKVVDPSVISERHENTEKETIPQTEPENDFSETDKATQQEAEYLTSNNHLPTKENPDEYSLNNVPDNILAFLIRADNINDISKVINNARNRGQVQFGRYSAAMLNPQGSHFIIFDPNNGKIVAILDKGSNHDRVNLKNNQLVEDFLETFKNMNIVWLQIY